MIALLEGGVESHRRNHSWHIQHLVRAGGGIVAVNLFAIDVHVVKEPVGA